MPTLKRQKSDGTWEFLQLTGADVVALAGEGWTDETIKGNADAIGDLDDLETYDQSDLVSAVNEVNEEIETHQLDSMPHQFLDGATPYRYGFKQEDGHLVFMYEEVV